MGSIIPSHFNEYWRTDFTAGDSEIFSKVNRFHIDEEKFVAAYGLSETCSGVVVNKGNVLKAKVAPEVNITSGIDFDSSHFDYKKLI